jgi:hypothetical protein
MSGHNADWWRMESDLRWRGQNPEYESPLRYDREMGPLPQQNLPPPPVPHFPQPRPR